MGEFTPMEKSSQDKCYLRSIELLARREYSRFKLTLKLKESGFSDQDIKATFDQLIQKNYFNESRYIEARLRGLAKKGQGLDLIRQKLSAENIFLEKVQIQEILNEEGLGQESILRSYIEKKKLHPPGTWGNKGHFAPPEKRS